MRIATAAAFILAASGAAAQSYPLAGRVFEVADRAELGEAELVARLAAADLAILGEVHDNSLHHALQTRLVAALTPGGIAFEQIPARSEAVVNGMLDRGTAPGEIGAAIGWAELGWPDWIEYSQIIAASPGAHVAGGGVEREDLMQAIREGAAAAWGASAAAWGLDRELDAPARAAIEDEMATAHCGLLPPEAARGMVEAQRLRDARFAAALLRALHRGGNGRAVLITGNGHARRDRGAAFYLRIAAPELRVLSVGILEAPEGAAAPDWPDLPYDFVAFTEPAQRPDPCEGLAERLRQG